MLSAYTGAAAALRGVPAEQDITTASVRLTASMLIRYQMPTYFVGAELCEALLETEAPDDLLFDEIQMPMPAMLFMLPTEFTKRYFGHEAPFITAARVPKGYLAKSAIRVRGVPAPDLRLCNPGDLFVSTMLIWENGLPMHYDSRAPAENTMVKELMAEEIVRYAKVGEWETTQAQDSHTATRLCNLAVNILLAMTAEPELVTREHLLEPAKKKGGKITRPAKWKPNFIGEHFKIVYETGDAAGTHRSPHAHWRSGHHRKQHHGPGNTLVKRIWIKPVYVGLAAK